MALGVPRDAIIHDYLLSRQYFNAQKEMGRLVAKYTELIGIDVSEDLLRPMLDVKESYLGTALEHIEKEYGTPERYLQSKFGISSIALERLRVRLTE